MTEAQVNEIFNELIQNVAQMEKVGVDRKLRYIYKNPGQRPTTFAKKLELLYKCDKLTLK